MRTSMLSLLENNAKLTASDLAALTGETEEAVCDTLAALENERVVCGYHTLINWDKTDRDYVTALIEIKVSPTRGQGFDKIAERIYQFDEVRAVYLMSGGFDLTVIVEGHSLKEVAHFVSGKLAPMESVIGTATHFVLKKYKDHGVIFDRGAGDDERMIVSP